MIDILKFSLIKIEWYVEGLSVQRPSSHLLNRMDKLIDESLRDIWFADDALFIVLAYGTTEFVIVHSRTVLPQTPETSHVSRVLDFKDSCVKTPEQFNDDIIEDNLYSQDSTT